MKRSLITLAFCVLALISNNSFSNELSCEQATANEERSKLRFNMYHSIVSIEAIADLESDKAQLEVEMISEMGWDLSSVAAEYFKPDVEKLKLLNEELKSIRASIINLSKQKNIVSARYERANHIKVIQCNYERDLEILESSKSLGSSRHDGVIRDYTETLKLIEIDSKLNLDKITACAQAADTPNGYMDCKKIIERLNLDPYSVYDCNVKTNTDKELLNCLEEE